MTEETEVIFAERIKTQLKEQHNERIRDNRRLRGLLILIEENPQLFPEWTASETADLGIRIYWARNVEVRIPWNPQRLQGMMNELEALGWIVDSIQERRHEDTRMTIRYMHPVLRLEEDHKKYGWQTKKIDIELIMVVHEDEIPETQNCRLVLISTDTITVEKEVPTYEVLCEEGYKETMEQLEQLERKGD